MTDVFTAKSPRAPGKAATARDEAYFRQLLEKLPAAAYTCDERGFITFFNARAVEMWGRAPKLNDPAERFCGSVRLLSPAGEPVLREECAMAKALLKGREFNGEEVILERPDGTRLTALAHANPIFDASGALTGAVNVLIDISDRKRMEDQLRASQERFRLVAETIPSIAWTADVEGHIAYVNDRWYRYCGMPSGHDQRLWPRDAVHPGDRALCAEAWHQAVRDGTEYRMEARLRRADRMYRWFEVHAVPLRDPQGAVLRWFGTTTDIDARKRAEEVAAFMSRASSELAQISDYRETLRRIADFAIPAFADWCGIFLVAEDGRVERLALNHEDPERVRLLHAMRDRYPYRPTDSIGPGKVLTTGESCWSQCMTDEMLAGFSHDAQHLAMLKALDFRSWVCVPIRLQQRIAGAMSFVMTDSGRVYSESQLRVAEDLAHRVSIAIENSELVAALREEHRRKDEFLAMLARELRNPLAPLRNSVQVLQAKAQAVPELQWAREVIDREVQHLSRLVDDLLDMSRAGKGAIELRRERMPVSAAVNSGVEMCRPLIEESRHQLMVSMPMEAIFVDADLTRMSQVVANLLNNAVKYTDAPGHIWVTLEREGGDAVIRVRDDGIGIPPEMLTRVFEIFTQIDRSRERPQGGLGLGLTLAKELVEMHGGALEARSAGTGAGSEFIVRLPAL
jgi:PAS domain S-box-containing protein